MRAAYIDHSFHQKTLSTLFFLDMLRKHFEVDEFWDESWQGGAAPYAERITRAEYDLIAVFQTEMIVPELVEAGAKNVVFIPMWDGCQFLPDSYWRSINSVRIVSFSRFLHEKLLRLGNKTAYFKYAPDPSAFDPKRDFSDLRGFFWQRRPEITWNTIKPLMSGTVFRSFHLHGAVDPDCSPLVMPSEDDLLHLPIKVSDWFESKNDFFDVLNSSNVFFAPRPTEGLGQSFLEAMAMGMCVVAPDAPTMNSYILHDVTGLLYNRKHPTRLDFSKAESYGRRARETIELTYERWKRDFDDRLPSFVFSRDDSVVDAAIDGGQWDLDRAIASKRSAIAKTPIETGGERPLSGGRRSRGLGRMSPNGEPLITVATVVRNSEDEIEQTILSVLAQDYPAIELIVIDGASTDGTVDIIRRCDDAIDYWVSEPDAGPYDAMNKAARLARGHWILFLNAGDWFYAPDSISRAIRHAPLDADFLVGHHMYLAPDGMKRLHRASSFDHTWNALRAGGLNIHWLQGIPCHQSTFTRVPLLLDTPYDTSFRIAADHDLMFRKRAQGAKFYNIDDVISVYTSGGLSLKNHLSCVDEWWRLAKPHGPQQKIDDFYLTSKLAMLRSPQQQNSDNNTSKQPSRDVFVRFQAGRRLARQAVEIEESGLFFESWYLRQYPEVTESGLHPILHYLTQGVAEGKNPSPFFDSSYYLAVNNDVREAGVNPLFHYIDRGASEGRPPNRWFDPERHLDENSNVDPNPLFSYIAKLAKADAR